MLREAASLRNILVAMGLSQHKLFNNSGIFGNEVDDNSHHSSLSTKRFLILDPRSPTDNIERTPIIVDKTPSATVDKVPYATVDKTPNATVGKAPNATDDETPNATVNKVPSATVDKTPSATTDQCFLSSAHYLSHTTWKTTLVVVEGVESGQHVADPRSPTPGIERTPLLLPCPQGIKIYYFLVALTNAFFSFYGFIHQFFLVLYYILATL